MNKLVSKFFVWIFAFIGSSMIGFAVWVHAHSAAPIIENKAAIHVAVNSLASGMHIARDIRKTSKVCDKIKARIERKRSDRLNIMLSPSRNDPELIQLKDRLDNEINDLEKDLEREQADLDTAENKESQLIAKLATT